MKRFLFLILALLMLVTLVACDNGEDLPDGGEDITDETTVEETVEISLDSIKNYSIIRIKTSVDALADGAVDLTVAMRALNPEIQLLYDNSEDIGEFEILLGNTSRPESAEFISTLCSNDYGYTVIGKKIVIAGKTDATSALAVEKFISDIMSGDFSDGVFYSSESDVVVGGEYPWDALTVDGKPFKEFAILYNGESAEIAEEFAEKCAAQIKYIPEVTHSGKTVDGLSIIFDLGGASNDYECVIRYGESGIILSSNTARGMEYLADRFFAKIEEAGKSDMKLTLAPKTEYLFDANEMSAMSFNVYVGNFVASRIKRVLTMIENYSPDTFGVQEASYDWILQLDRKFGDEYARVGEGRGGGNSEEFSAIYYKKDLFELLDSDTKWLSDTPDKVSKYEDSQCKRIFTYAHLRRISDGREIMVVNTHLDHVGTEARLKQAQVLMNFMKDYTDMPLIITGDFNTKANTAEYNTIIEGGVVNSSDIAKETKRGPTFTNYGKSNSIIDFIFVTENYIDVSSYAVCGEMIDGDYPSDHHPVIIKYTLK